MDISDKGEEDDLGSGFVAGRRLVSRFTLEECLKRRALTQTWRATDTRDGGAVVVKLLFTGGLSSALRLRLEHEARVLAELDLASRPVAVGSDGTVMYLVQTFVPGHDLRARLDRGQLDIESSLLVAMDVFRALSKVHELGIFHRDIKPANIIVDGDDRLTSAALIDFGLARSAWLDRSVRDEPVGTARYLAPEAAGLVDAGIDERADLYSAGVVLYECLAGRAPFEGKTVGDVLRAHATEDPVPLRTLRQPIPSALDGLVARLLAKDPAERYQSAAAVVADLESLIDGLRSGVADPPVAIGMADRRRTLAEAGYIGRRTELEALAALLDGPGRRGGLILLEAESGGGKSRILDEACLRLSADTRLLRGQGLDRVAMRPFQILDGVAVSVTRECQDEPEFAATLQDRLAAWTDTIAGAVPDLAEVLGVEAGTEGPEAYGEARTISALCALLDAIAADRPTVVVLDDCQWADSLTLKLLSEWPVRGRLPADSQLVIVAAFRSEEVGENHPLRKAPAIAHLRLSPMSSDDIVALCESMAGPLPEDASAVVVRLAEGSPFMASAVLRGMVEMHVLEHVGDGWQVDPEALAGAQTSRRAGLFLTRRLELLSVPARRLLSAGAVLGKGFNLDNALELADLDVRQAAEALDEARRRRVIWVDEVAGTCAFTHDKLRETLLTQLPTQVRAALHRRAAGRLELLEPQPSFELAYHFDAAGMARDAFPHAMAAARDARARHALDVSVAQYRIAERGVSDFEEPVQAELHEELGEVLSLAGEYDEAEIYLTQALGLIKDRDHRSSLEGKLGDVAFRRGDHVAARDYVEGALRQLGRWVPKRQFGYVVAALWEIFVQIGHTLVPRRLGRRRPEGAERQFLAARLYSRLAYIYWFSAGRMPCAWTHLRGMNLVERYPASPELAQAWSEHAPVMTMLPYYKRGITYARKSFDVRQALGDEWGQGQSLSFYGVVLYAASRYRECIDACLQAVETLNRMGDRWEENTASWHIAFSQYRLGQLSEAIDTSRRLHARASAIGDISARGISLSAWSRASGGHVPENLVAAELAMGTEDAHKSVEVRVAETVRLIREGRWAAACEVIDDALEIIKRAGLRQEYVAPAYSWAATARRGLAESIPPIAGAEREAAVRRAQRACRRARIESYLYRNNRPHALREAAIVAAMAGRPGKAERLLAKSAEVARAQDAAHELILTEGIADELSRPPDATAASPIADGPHTPSAPADREWSVSLADRFSTVLSVSHEITAAPSPEAVFGAARRATERLLRGERCHVLELPDDGDIDQLSITESGNPLDGISRELLRRAVDTGEPVVAGESLADDSSESMVLSAARSTLCAPINCDGRSVAAIYVTSRHLAGLFGEQEIQLASFITTLAGAALEHVAGSEARFRSLVQNSSDVITIVDEYGRILYQSASLFRVLGIAPEAHVGRSVAEWVHPDDRATLDSLIADVARAGEMEGIPTLIEWRVSDSAGEWRNVESAVSDLRGEAGVRGIVLNTRDVSERMALEEELRHRAWHDIVTGLANRALFTERVGEARARSARSGKSFAVLFLDLDDFKSINDTLGHATGDEVLRVVARRLDDCVRGVDTVARFGGDEFAILLEDADAARARHVCERVLSSLMEPIELRGRALEVQASIGMVLSDSSEMPESLLAAADAALYVAKAKGKRRYEAFEPSMRAAAVARAGLRNELDHALERNELRLAYQPVITVSGGELAGFEALIRWPRPHGMVLGPDQFIPLAEESGAIVAIGAWVLETACRQAMEWQALTGRNLTMAVNVSARQLLNPSLIDDVRRALDRSAMVPSDLVLEITESATVQDTESVMSKLRQLKSIGVRLAIDDFGTGYSALSYLRRLPVDELKIDRSFVSGLSRNAEDVAIVQTVINLADALQLQTVAEGVETLDQLEMLARLGCDHAQGYNWRRPAFPDEIEAWLRADTPSPRPGRPGVLIVDDSASVRSTLKVALELDGRFEVLGEAADGREALSRAADLKPEVILLDLMMPGTSGLDVLSDLHRVSPGSTVVVLSSIDLAELTQDTRDACQAVLDKTRDLLSVVDRLEELVLSVG
ncbi:MAG TPA: EAL domain-containing protein [Acidimicrobiales bacterium]|jgi:diguanylate cyclase (GGDEF)-like protein/PAS domain S-box-containing protein|nr:EAL domain-containing protein [Acidimicrobiales bacterium]